MQKHPIYKPPYPVRKTAFPDKQADPLVYFGYICTYIGSKFSEYQNF